MQWVPRSKSVSASVLLWFIANTMEPQIGIPPQSVSPYYKFNFRFSYLGSGSPFMTSFYLISFPFFKGGFLLYDQCLLDLSFFFSFFLPHIYLNNNYTNYYLKGGSMLDFTLFYFLMWVPFLWPVFVCFSFTVHGVSSCTYSSEAGALLDHGKQCWRQLKDIMQPDRII